MQSDQLLAAVTDHIYGEQAPPSLRSEITNNLNGSVAEAVNKTDKMDFMAVEMSVEAGMYLDGELRRREQISSLIDSTGALIEYCKRNKDLRKDDDVQEAIAHLKDRYGSKVFEGDKTEMFTGKRRPNRERAELTAEFDIISQTDIVNYMEQHPQRVDTSRVTDFTETALVLANAVIDSNPEAVTAIHSFALKANEISVTQQIKDLGLKESERESYFAVRAALNARAFGLANAAYITKVDAWNARHPDTDRELEEISKERLSNYLNKPENKERTAVAMLKQVANSEIPEVADGVEKDATGVAYEVLSELLNRDALGILSEDTVIKTALTEFHNRELNRGIQVFAQGFKKAAEADTEGIGSAKDELYNLLYRATASALVGGEIRTIRLQQEQKLRGQDDEMSPLAAIATIAPEKATEARPYIPTFNFPPEVGLDEKFADSLTRLGKYYEEMHGTSEVTEAADIEALVREVYDDFKQLAAAPEKSVSGIQLVALPPKTA